MELLYNPWVMMGLFVAALAIGGVLKVKRGDKQTDDNTMQLNAGFVAVALAAAFCSRCPR